MHVSEEKERVPNYRPVYVTEISDSLHFYTQDVETGNVRVEPLIINQKLFNYSEKAVCIYQMGVQF